MKRVRTLFSAIVFSAIVPIHTALACSVCFGESETQSAKAINSALLFLLGVTAVVLTGLTIMVRHVVKTHQKNEQESGIR